MSVSTQRQGGYLDRPAPSGLADVIEVILDKGLVIDAYVRVSLVGIELLTIDARIVIASVDTYLRFAEAVNRLDLQPSEQVAGLPGMVHELREGGAKGKTSGVLGAAKDALTGGSSDDDDDEQESRSRRPARKSSSASSSSRSRRRSQEA